MWIASSSMVVPVARQYGYALSFFVFVFLFVVIEPENLYFASRPELEV